jgi:hypothetical protein
VSTLGGAISGFDVVNSAGPQGRARFWVQRLVVALAVRPGPHNFHLARGGVQQNKSAAEFGEKLRRHARDHLKRFFQIAATLQHLRHTGQQTGPSRALPQFLQHVLVLGVDLLLGQGAFLHLPLQPRVDFRQRGGFLFEL